MSHALTHRAIDLTRKDFTVTEILALQDQGILSEDDKFELADGEIVPMQSKTHRHEIIKSPLAIDLVRALARPPLDRFRKLDVSFGPCDPRA